jgi:HEAT repeat protein
MRAQRSFGLALTVCSLLSGSLATSVQAAPTTPDAATKTEATKPAAARVTATRAAAVTPREGALGPEEHARRLQAALAGLKSSEPEEIQRALLSLRELSGRAAAEGIVARLRLGLPPQLTELSLDVVATLNQPLAAPVLSELTLHRRWQIRAKALAALAALRVRSSVSVLLYALDDPSAEVRSAAARGLGMIGDPRATPALNAALARGVDGALEGLAALATSKQVPAILERAKAGLSANEPALSILITRTNLPVVTKLKVINFVQAHDAESEAEHVLALWRDKLKLQGDLRLLAALAPKAKDTPKTGKTEVVHVSSVKVPDTHRQLSQATEVKP